MPKPSDRDARLAEALRANLRRRKASGRKPAGAPSGVKATIDGDEDGGAAPAPGDGDGGSPNPAAKSA
jgi:hypothetical protein